MSRPESVENRRDILYRDYPRVYEAFSNTPYHPTIYEQLSGYARQVTGIEREAAVLRQAQQKARRENVFFL